MTISSIYNLSSNNVTLIIEEFLNRYKNNWIFLQLKKAFSYADLSSIVIVLRADHRKLPLCRRHLH